VRAKSRAGGEQQQAEEAPAVDRDDVLAEEAIAVDQRRADEVAGYHESHRRGDADPRRPDGDGEDDEDTHHAPEPEPRRLVQRRTDAGDAALPNEQYGQGAHERDDDREGQGRHDANSLA
jgi:hypothetical protein